MKKHIVLALSAFAVVGLSGCGGGSGSSDGPVSEPVTLFLQDILGNADTNVPYTCSSTGGATGNTDGEFTFYPPDSCEFDFGGYNGDIYPDPLDDEVILIVDENGVGKDGIPYSCESGTSGRTGSGDFAGDFNYMRNDVCTFQF